jgi:PKD repeat protein
MKKQYYLFTLFLISAFNLVHAQQSCNADFWYSNSPGTLTVNFVDSSSYGPGFQAQYFWTFGEAFASSSQMNPTYTYSSPGTYLVYLSIFDSLNTCFDSTSKYVTVPMQRPGNCNASFTKAKDSATAFGVILTNTSSTSSSSVYFWDFGDGNTATGATPAHTYQNFGSYNVCLTVFDSLSNCVNTFCDTVGLDSNGNLKSNGFSLTVVLPNITSVDENTLENALSLYPNPVEDQLNLEIGSLSNDLELRLIDLSGKTLREFQLTTGRQSIDLSDLNDGLYLLQFNTGNETVTKKILKQ